PHAVPAVLPGRVQAGRHARGLDRRAPVLAHPDHGRPPAPADPRRVQEVRRVRPLLHRLHDQARRLPAAAGGALPVTDHRTGLLGAVGRFFFLPTDPTALGFMRIVTGLLLLYTHAVYSLSLKEFFGPDAWWDHQAGNRQRREAPYVPTPLGWTEFYPTIRVDDVPHRRTAEIEFLRNLPLDK